LFDVHPVLFINYRCDNNNIQGEIIILGVIKQVIPKDEGNRPPVKSQALSNIGRLNTYGNGLFTLSFPRVKVTRRSRGILWRRKG
jgi:hypothetical protein